MSAHTLGPWCVGGPYPGVSVCTVTEDGIWELVVVVDHRSTGKQDPRALADAHLIAAAPDMFEILQTIIGHGIDYPDLEAVARAAIAKATGEKP